MQFPHCFAFCIQCVKLVQLYLLTTGCIAYANWTAARRYERTWEKPARKARELQRTFGRPSAAGRKSSYQWSEERQWRGGGNGARCTLAGAVASRGFAPRLADICTPRGSSDSVLIPFPFSFPFPFPFPVSETRNLTTSAHSIDASLTIFFYRRESITQLSRGRKTFHKYRNGFFFIIQLCRYGIC